MQYPPFYNILSRSLHILLGVEDIRTVRKRIEELGVQIYGEGKNSYIITEEVITAIRSKDNSNISRVYTPKGSFSDL